MKSVEIRNEMHQAIDVIDDKDFLKAIHKLLSDKTKTSSFDLSDEQKEELLNRKKLHKSGKSKSYTFDEVKKYAISKLSK